MLARGEPIPMPERPVRFRGRLAARIREARERLRLTQQQLASAAGFSHLQTISDIERGARDVKAWELVRLARALHLSVPDLLGGPLTHAPAVLWRKTPPERERLEAAFLERCRQYRFLEELTGEVREAPLPVFHVDPGTLSHGRVAALGEQVAQALSLGAKPATALTSVLEDDYGVKLWYEDLGEDGSASCSVGGFGTGILVNAREPRWRRHFSVAHELFHLLTWEDLPPGRLSADTALAQKAETLANTFAAALLLPAGPVRAEADRRTKEGAIAIQNLIDLARQYQVSTDALLWRLVNLGRLQTEQVEQVLRDPAIQALDAASRRADWDRPPFPPERFVRLAHLAHIRGRLSRARMAELLGVDLSDLDDFLTTHGLTDAPSLATALTAPL